MTTKKDKNADNHEIRGLFARTTLKRKMNQLPDALTNLSLLKVLNNYNLKPDPDGKLNCPFHSDEGNSLQINHITNSWFCSDPDCPAGNGDQVGFIMNIEKLSEREALQKAKIMTGVSQAPVYNQNTSINPIIRIQLLTKVWSFYVNAVKQTQVAKDYIVKRKLDKLEIGFNSGRFHLRGNTSDTDINNLLGLGILSKIQQAKEGAKPVYKSWAKDSIIFPQRDKQGNIVSLYGRNINDTGENPHFYMKDAQGLYPSYPKPETRTLILAQSVINAASLIQHLQGATEPNLSILACYGSSGLTDEHKKAISELRNLKEIIFFFDGDQSGITAPEQYGKELNDQLGVTISMITMPAGEDINSICCNKSVVELTVLLSQKKTIYGAKTHVLRPVLNIAPKETAIPTPEPVIIPAPAPVPIVEVAVPEVKISEHAYEEGELITENPQEIIFLTENLKLRILGGIDMNNLGRLKVTIYAQSVIDKYKTFRDDTNLFNNSSTSNLINNISGKLEINSTYVKKVIEELTQKLEDYRTLCNQQAQIVNQVQVPQMSIKEKQDALELLKSKNLVKRTSELIAQSGLVGEEKNGLLLFFLFLSRLTDFPLHGIVFGKSGAGKTYSMTKVGECIPEEDVKTATSITEQALYHSPEGCWMHKVLLLEDYDGVLKALFPLRELMSKQCIDQATTVKDKKGNNVTEFIKVKSALSVCGATTKDKIYEDNANRSYLVYVDESPAHVEEVSMYQKREAAGLIDKIKESQAKQLLKNAQRLLGKVNVINPYAIYLNLPDSVVKKLRTYDHYLKLINIITLYHQQQRELKYDSFGKPYIETTLDDIAIANNLVRECLLRKSDELSGNLRGFFELLKDEVRDKDTFMASEVRKFFKIHPEKLKRFLTTLEAHSYITKVGGHRNTGYEYKILMWEEYDLLRAGINVLDQILQKLREQFASH